MGYFVNVDIPTGMATVHTDNPNNRASCRPQEKAPENGYWTESLGSEEEVPRAVREADLALHRCMHCMPSSLAGNPDSPQAVVFLTPIID